MRLLIPDERKHSIGEIFGYVIGVLYFFEMIYCIYRKHLISLFQMFMNYLDDNENEEQYKAIFYSCLNSIQFLILCFYSTLVVNWIQLFPQLLGQILLQSSLFSLTFSIDIQLVLMVYQMLELLQEMLSFIFYHYLFFLFVSYLIF